MNEIQEPFRWRTMKGEILKLSEMDTRHIFNAMKMLFNHLCEAHAIPTVWHQHRYRDFMIASKRIPKVLARHILFFIAEIERRGDLPEKFHEPYWKIIDTIRYAVDVEPELLPVRRMITVGPRVEGE